MNEPVEKFQVTEDVLFQTVYDEAVLLNLNNDRYYGLDNVGARMWQLLAEHGEPDRFAQPGLQHFPEALAGDRPADLRR